MPEASSAAADRLPAATDLDVPVPAMAIELAMSDAHIESDEGVQVNARMFEPLLHRGLGLALFFCWPSLSALVFF